MTGRALHTRGSTAHSLLHRPWLHITWPMQDTQWCTHTHKVTYVELISCQKTKLACFVWEEICSIPLKSWYLHIQTQVTLTPLNTFCPLYLLVLERFNHRLYKKDQRQKSPLQSCAIDVIWNRSLHNHDRAAEPQYRVPALTPSCPIISRTQLPIRTCHHFLWPQITN